MDIMATKSFNECIHIKTQEDADRLNAAIDELIANPVDMDLPDDLDDQLEKGKKALKSGFF